MRWKYNCPKCGAHLNPESNIILRAEHDGQFAIFAFHSEPGNYEVVYPEGIDPEAGQEWSFSCPACGGGLTYEEDTKLAMLDMTDAKGVHHKVFFSRIAGNKATILVHAEGVEVMGPDSEMWEHIVTSMQWGKMF